MNGESRIISKHKAGISYKNKCQQLDASKLLIQSLIKIYKESDSTANLTRSDLTGMVRQIVRLVNNNPRTTRKHLRGHLADEGVDDNLNAVTRP